MASTAQSANNPEIALESTPATVLKPLVYVCVLSKFNLPQLEACLVRRPSDLVLVVSSDFQPAIDGAENLTALLEQELPGIRIHRPDLTAAPGAPKLIGDDALNAQDWMAQVLEPFLEQHRQGRECWLNLTGGTKATSLALSMGYPWSGLDYKPTGKNELSHYQINLQQAPGNRVYSDLGKEQLPSVTPQQVARIYNKAYKEKIPNPFRAATNSQALAERLFDALHQREPSLVALFAAFSRIWSEQRDKTEFPQWQHARLTLPLQDFLAGFADQHATPDTLSAWLHDLETLADDPKVFSVQEGLITLPGNKAKKRGKAFKDWLSGDWMEQLTAHWLQSRAAIPESAMTFGLQAGEEEDVDREREADVLIHHAGKTYLLEVKADVAPGEKPADAERQLSSLQKRYGQPETLLVVGPEFRQRLENNYDWPGFQQRCAQQQVKVCWDADSLGAAFGKSSD